MARHPEWEFEYGEEIYEGRLALQSIGGGEAYETWLAWDPTLFSLVVLKLIRPHRVGESRYLEDLRREHTVLTTLAHPIILRSFGVVDAGDHPHLVLEHLDGPNLRSLIKRSGPVPLEQLLPLALHICSALHYMHALHYVHLDVKPRNLIMGPQPRLIDMSIARSFDQARTIGSGIGTPAYMAPEQCDPAAHGQPGPPADVWGLGVTLYEAVTGRRPFSYPVRDGEDWVYPQVSEEPGGDFPRYTPSEVIELVRDCLSREPAERPTAADVALRLEPVVAGLPRLAVGKRGFRFRT